MTNTKKEEYITFVIELEEAVDETLDYIEDCIDNHKTSFLATNPKSGKPEEVPVRHALNALNFLYQEAKSKFSNSKDLAEKLYVIAYEHLHTSIRLMVFYFENRLFNNIELEKKIMSTIMMYYESRDIAGEHLRDRIFYNSK